MSREDVDKETLFEKTILSNQKTALNDELTKLENSQTQETKGAVKQAITKMLQDKLPSGQNKFVRADNKTDGVSAGYVAKEKDTQNTFLLKEFFKSESNCKTKQDKDNRRDGVQELISATMYQFLLYDRVPKIQLVIPDENNSDRLYIRSKYFENSIQLHEKLQQSSRPELEGFEKAIAACHMLGEIDYHDRNILVNKDGVVTKIDHGRSFLGHSINRDFKSLTDLTNYTFNNFGYQDMQFDVRKYSKALNQMIVQLNENQIDQIVDQRVAELAAAGFDPKGLVDGASDMARLGDQYKSIAKENLENIKEIARQVEIVAKFSNRSEEFMQGEWLGELILRRRGPITYAANYGVEIDGKDPVIYAIDNKLTIDGEAPLKYAANEGIEIDGKDPIIYAIDNKLTIDGQEPLKYAIKNNIEIDGQEPLKYISNSVKIENSAQAKPIDSRNTEVTPPIDKSTAFDHAKEIGAKLTAKISTDAQDALNTQTKTHAAISANIITKQHSNLKSAAAKLAESRTQVSNRVR